ncbi:hypothetical protein YGAWVPHU_CDS0037 [Salmonella phage SeKF_13]
MLRRRLRLILRHFSAPLRGLLSEDKQTYSLPREARIEAYRRYVKRCVKGSVKKGVKKFFRKIKSL